MTARDPDTMDATDRAIINLLQDGIPICERPFLECASRLAVDEATLIDRLASLLADGTLSRVGPMFDAERMGGAFTLCAMSVPAERFDDVAATVNAFEEVAHNYERSHELNMWFVIGAQSQARVDAVIADIEHRCAVQVLDFPKLEEFFIGLRLEA